MEVSAILWPPCKISGHSFFAQIRGISASWRVCHSITIPLVFPNSFIIRIMDPLALWRILLHNEHPIHISPPPNFTDSPHTVRVHSIFLFSYWASVWFQPFASFCRFFVEANNRLFKVLYEVASRVDRTLTVEAVLEMGLDPYGDRLFIASIVELYDIHVVLPDVGCC